MIVKREKICCVILNYNNADEVIQLVEKIINYSMLDYIVVVDNNSTDDSYDKMKRINNEKVIILETNDNKGYGYGNNFGIKYAKENLRCKYAIISNPDVIFTNELIIDLYRKIGLYNATVASAIQIRNGIPIEAIAWRVPDAFSYVFTYFKKLKKFCSYLYKNSYYNDEVVCVGCIPGAFLMICVDDFLFVGGYDESVFLYCEETILGFKLKSANFKTILLTDKYYIHNHISINKYENIRQTIFYLYDSKLIYLKKYLKANILFILITYLQKFKDLIGLYLHKDRY